MSPFKVRPATRADIPSMAQICEDAFSSDPIFRVMNSGSQTSENYLWRRSMFEEEWDFPGRTSFVVESEETGDSKIVAYARWYFPYSLTKEEEAAGKGVDIMSGEEPLPAGINKAFFFDFFTKLFGYRKKYVDHSSCYVLDMLAVDPNQQRKGLGGMLLRHVLERVDREGRTAYLEASTKGLGLYLKHGWKEIDEMSIDMKPYGGEVIEVEKIMMRGAKTI